MKLGGRGSDTLSSKTRSFSTSSVAMAIADVFSKNGYTIPNKNAKILKIFERVKTLKSRWVIP